MVEITKYQHRDENAHELNVLLEKLLANLEETSVGVDDALMDLTTDEANRTSRDPMDLLNNLEDTCRYFELKTMSDIINPIIEDLRGIIYCGSEFVPLLERKPQAPSVKRRDYPIWLMENVKPLIKHGVTSQKECAKMLNRDPTGLSKMVYRAYNLPWNNFVMKIEEGVL